MYRLGKVIDVKGNTYVGVERHQSYTSVAITKEEGVEFKLSGRLPDNVVAILYEPERLAMMALDRAIADGVKGYNG